MNAAILLCRANAGGLCIDCAPFIDTLGGFELQVLLAVMRLGEDVYGVPIADTLEEASGRDINAGSIYITLDRLESKGFVTSRLGESTPERGGRAKTYFQVTGKGVRAVRAAQRTLVKLWSGVPELKGGNA